MKVSIELTYVTVPSVLVTITGRRIYTCNTFLITKYQSSGLSGVKRWLSADRVLALDLLLLPIHIEYSHWCLVAVEVPSRRLLLYDSLDYGQKCLGVVKKFLCDLTGIFAWTESGRAACWKQHNNYDCGVHVLRTAYLLNRGQSDAIAVESKKGYLQISS